MLRYYQVKVKTDGSFRDTYYVEADSLISENEISDYVAQIAVVDAILYDDDCEALEVASVTELDREDALPTFSDYHMRPKLQISPLNDLMGTVLSIGHYEKDFSPQTQEFFIFSAAAGQDSDVTALGKTDEENPREQVVLDGYYDCLYQLKKYFQIPGVVMATGLFTIQTITEEEYEMEEADRVISFV